MRIAIGADHAGYELKNWLAERLRAAGHEVFDLGTDTSEPVDYPDYAETVGRMVLDGRADRGVIICGSGVGAAVAANKLPGIRAGMCHDTYSARQGVEHDDMNVLALGARVIGIKLAEELVKVFVHAQFSGEERYVRRLDKVRQMEGARELEPEREE